jgi:hypothetical protein
MKALGAELSKKYRTSLRLPDRALENISSSMSKGSYGTRERSKWVCEAVKSLSITESYWDLIAEQFMDQGDNELIPITIDNETSKLLSEIEIQFLKNYKDSLIDISMIIRAAIFYRLLTEGGGAVS